MDRKCDQWDYLADKGKYHKYYQSKIKDSMPANNKLISSIYNYEPT